MTTPTIEQVEVTKKPKHDEIVHHYDPVEVFKCMSGLLYQSSCGITFDPKIQKLGEQAHDLTNMEKCVMCQTVLSQK